MADFIEYWSYLPNLLEDIKALSQRRKSESFTVSKVHRPRSASTNVFSVRNSVCVAGNARDAVLSVKQLVYRLLSGRCAVESFHFRNEDDIKDGALFVPKVILVALFQPGRKLIDDEGDEGQLDLAYDEICENGAELMVVYMDLPKLVYPINTQNPYHVRLEQLVFPEQKIVKNLADHGLLLTLTENSRRLNKCQEQRMLEWLLKPVNPKTHPVFKTCATINSIQKKRLDEFRQSFDSTFDDPGRQSYQCDSFQDINTFSSASFRGLEENSLSSDIKRTLEPNIRIRQTASMSDSSDNDLDEVQMTHHGFMKSMESYPLLKRNSRSRQKKKSCNQKGRGPPKMLHSYGAVVKKEPSCISSD